ncbi:hypothetical protein D9M68_327820 [compost metagenome]
MVPGKSHACEHSRGRKACLKVPRVDIGGVDAGSRQLHAQCFVQRLEREFAGAVIGLKRQADQTRQRTDVDDATHAPRTHIRHDGTNGPNRPEEVGFHLPTGFVQFGVFDCATNADTGIVDQHVNTTCSSDHFFDRFCHRDIVGHIKRNHPNLPLIAAGLSCGAKYGVSLRCQSLGDRLPETG